MVGSKENCKLDLGVKGLSLFGWHPKLLVNFKPWLELLLLLIGKKYHFKNFHSKSEQSMLWNDCSPRSPLRSHQNRTKLRGTRKNRHYWVSEFRDEIKIAVCLILSLRKCNVLWRMWSFELERAKAQCLIGFSLFRTPLRYRKIPQQGTF